ncbi:MAG: alcohol dehydrogenase, partial [Acidimicrobiia bacterium]
NEYIRKELTVLGSRNNAGVFGDAARLVQANSDRIGELISHTFPLEQVPDALRLALDHPDQTRKVIIEVGK